ncbi:MAG: glycosyltransferase [Firmicutes bacterium]|nr:glycosyltransferase [Bacillota bacterium]
MSKWYLLEIATHYRMTLPFGFSTLHLPLVTPPPQMTPQRFAQQLAGERPDVLLLTGWTSLQVEPYFRVMDRYCEETQALKVFWSFEDPLHTQTWSKYIVERVQPDLIFTHAFESVALYRSMGKTANYLPFACDPTLHRKRTPCPEDRVDIALVATLKEHYRSDWWRMHALQWLLQPALQSGLRVGIWGKGWQEYHEVLPFPVPAEILKGPIAYTSVPEIYNRAGIVLGLQNAPDLLTQRTFEVLGSGAFLLTIDTPAVRRHFVPGQHLAVTESPEQTAAQIAFYLNHPAERNAIAQQGQQEVYAHHTYAHRVAVMAEETEKVLQARRKAKPFFLPSLPDTLQTEVRATHDFTWRSEKEGVLGRYLTVGNVCTTTGIVVQRCGFLYFPTEAIVRFLKEKQSPIRLREAHLSLFVAEPPRQAEQIALLLPKEKWDEASLNAHRLPACTDQNVADFWVPKAFEPLYPWSENQCSITITTLVQAWLSGKPNYGLSLVNADPGSTSTVNFIGTRWKGNDFYRFPSYATRFHPRLTLTFEWVTPAGQREKEPLLVAGEWPAFL